MMRRVLVALAVLAVAPGAARGGPWTRDQGHGFVGTSYHHLAADRFYSFDGKAIPIVRYTQHLWALYAELGLVDRWLTVVVDGVLLRRNTLDRMGATQGMGDFRVGFWSGLLTAPFRLLVGVTFGVPVGDAAPSARSGADGDAQQIARTLPTGDGEEDVEARLSLGYGWNGSARYPLRHYLVAEAGVWLRTHGFAHSFVYRLEVGTQLPWTVVNRFWLSLRLAGVESFAGGDTLARSDAGFAGLGNGVSYMSPGVELSCRVVGKLAVSLGVDGAVRARLVPAAAQVKAGLGFEW